MKLVSAAGVLLAALAVCAPARSEEPAPEDARNEQNDDSALALFAGGAVTLVALGAGGVMIARGSEPIQNVGLLGGQATMALSPFVAHAIAGETRRGFWFSLPLLAPVTLNSFVVGFFPTIIKRAPAGIQYMTWTSATISIVGSTIGVLDAVRAGERRASRDRRAASSFSILPMLGETTGALFVGSL